MSDFLAYINVTPGGLLLLIATMSVLGLMGIIGRQHQKEVQRTKFDLGRWFADWVNWATPIVNLAGSIILLAIRESIAPMIGVQVTAPAEFELFMAFVLGVGGPFIWGKVLKMIAAATNGSPGPVR